MLLVGVVGLTGCSDDGNDAGGVIGGTPEDDASMPVDASGDTGDVGVTQPDATTDNDTGVHRDTSNSDAGGDTGNPSDLCGGRECPDDQICIDDECQTPGEVRCADAPDKGTLARGESMTLSGSFPAQTSSALETSCATTEGGSEFVYTFESQHDVQITSSIDQPADLDTRVEFRRGACAPENTSGGSFEEQICTDSDRSFFAPAGSVWYVIVEKNAGTSGSFDLTLEAEKACAFGGIGTMTCLGKSLAICEESTSGDPVKTTWQCPDACNNQACVGNSCSNPISISASSGFSKSFTGDLSAFTPQINLQNNNTCTINGTNYNAGGPEVVFELTGVQSGQTITVETSQDSNSNVVYVSNNCPQSDANFLCHSTWDELDQTNSTTVQQAGTYYIIVDKGTPTTNPFNYQISVN